MPGQGGRQRNTGGRGRRTGGRSRPSHTRSDGRQGGQRQAGRTDGGQRQAFRKRAEKNTFTIPPEARVFRVGVEHGSDLAHFLADSLPGGLSVRAVRRALDQGRCLVNGRAENFGSRKLIRGDIVAFVPPTGGEDQARYQKKSLVHIDDDLLVYDKPPGLPVTATDAGKGPNLVDLLRQHHGDELEAAHRLDADTSGLVLLARSQAMLTHLQQCFQDHAVQKTYLALVRGAPPERGERKTYLLLQEKGKGFERWGTGKGSGALQAITHWQVEETIKKTASLVRVEPRTGRTHQIRVHFAEMGHPLFGDRVYGDRRDPVFASRHLLHASGIRVPGPTGKELRFRSRLPKDFKAVLNQLQAGK